MLKNITKGEVTIKYNGIYKTIEPGGEVDVRDFEVNTKSALEVERHLIGKYGADKIQQTASKEVSLEKENAELRAENKALKAELEAHKSNGVDADEPPKAVKSRK